jgi:hypothetical protein
MIREKQLQFDIMMEQQKRQRESTCGRRRLFREAVSLKQELLRRLSSKCVGCNDTATISAENHSRPAILTSIKLTFTVAMSAVCFENNRNVARTFPSRISRQGSFFMSSSFTKIFAFQN